MGWGVNGSAVWWVIVAILIGASAAVLVSNRLVRIRKWGSKLSSATGALTGTGLSALFLVVPSQLPNLAVETEGWIGLSVEPEVAWKGPKPAVVTYLLVGDVGGFAYAGTDARIKRARQVLRAALAEAQLLQSAKNILDRESFKRANLFCLPSTGRNTEPVGLRDDAAGIPRGHAEYNFDLALRYRDRFRRLLEGQDTVAGKLQATGPWLVASRVPVVEATANSPVLLIDLSEVHPNAVPLYIAAFKDAVRHDEVVSSKALTPLRALLVSKLIELNQAIPFVAEAQADTRTMLQRSSDPASGAASAASSPK